MMDSKMRISDSNFTLTKNNNNLNNNANETFYKRLSKNKITVEDINSLLKQNKNNISEEVYKLAIQKIIGMLDIKESNNKESILFQSQLKESSLKYNDDISKLDNDIKNLTKQSDKNRDIILANTKNIDKMKDFIKQIGTVKGNKGKIKLLDNINDFLLDNKLIEKVTDEDIAKSNTKALEDNLTNLKAELKSIKEKLKKKIPINIESPKFMLMERKIGDKENLGEGVLFKVIRENIKKILFFNVKNKEKEYQLKILKNNNKNELKYYKNNIENIQKDIAKINASILNK